jgi:alpha-glucosidase (family GH31 glycosyl hydrolase)
VISENFANYTFGAVSVSHTWLTSAKFCFGVGFILTVLVQLSPLFAQSYLGNVRSYSTIEKSIVVQTDTSAVKFTFYKSNIVRIDFLSTLETSIDSSIVVVQDTTTHVDYFVVDSDSTLTICTSSLHIVCSKYPLRIGFYSQEGKPILREPISGGLGSQRALRIVNFYIKPEEHFYGTGERGIDLDLRGCAFESHNEQHGGYGSPVPPTMNVNIPFIISTGNYGLYFDNTYGGHFDIGRANPYVFTYSVDGGELSYYFIYDSTMMMILSDYAWLTGNAPLLPKWAYGYIQSKYGYRSESDARQMIQRMRSDSIPCDAIVLDLYWFRNMGDLSWNTELWQNPLQITRDFLKNGFKTIVITEPYIVQPSSNFAYAKSAGYFVKDSLNRPYILDHWWACNCNAGLLDITNPDARKWWWFKYYLIFSSGVSGLWTDLGEPERDYSDMKFYGGTDAKIHNIYNFLWAKMLYEGFNNSFPNKRFFNLTRSGYAGIQRFGTVTWSGDVAKTFGGLAVQIPMLLNMGMAGIVYDNSDIGGFDEGTTTPELYTRWMEFGTFCPVMRAHGYDGDNGTEPWTFGPETEDIVRNFMRLRYSLLPYNYTCAYEAYAKGLPMARPIVLEYPDDPNVFDESEAYLWGEDFLVAPVVHQGEMSKMFYLPRGKWIDFWTDKMYTGGTTITISAPLGRLPLFVRSGSIIPMQPVADYVDEFPSDTIILAVYPDLSKVASFALYEDDGNSLAYQKGLFSITKFTERSYSGNNTMEITVGRSLGEYDGKPVSRVYVLAIHRLSNAPSEVRISDNVSETIYRLPFLSSKDSLNISSEGSFYDSTSHVLFVKIYVNTGNEYHIQVDGVSIAGLDLNSIERKRFNLEQDLPNPFNLSTTIR